MKIIGIIPARYASIRFPGKPLVMIGNKPMVQHVYERVSGKLTDVLVATDDQRIYDCVLSFGGTAVMTSEMHNTGTSRCIEAYNIYTKQTRKAFDVAINIQGDEPTLQAGQIDELSKCFEDRNTQIATLIKRIELEDEIFNPNVVKVVYDHKQFAMYFSRWPVPYMREAEQHQWAVKGVFYKHIGIYAFRASVLSQIENLGTSAPESAESLEQLNWLYHGFQIKVQLTQYSNIGVDTPQDLEKLIVKGS